MQSWREQKRIARRVVHDTMAIPALHYATAGATAVAIRARLQTKFAQIGDDRSMGWAEREAVKPRLIFMLAQMEELGIVLNRNQIVYFQPGEAYNIDNLLPPDDITVTAEVTRLSRKQYQDAGLPAVGSQP